MLSIHDLRELRTTVNKLIDTRNWWQSKLDEAASKIPELEKSLSTHQDAIKVLAKIGQLHRQVTVDQLNTLITNALQAVFDRPYDYKIVIEEKRGQLEMRQLVSLNGLELDPEFSMGGGVLDVISLTLRVVLWSMMRSRTDAVMVLDEPFRCVSNDHIDNAAILLKRLSQKLSLQFIIVTHRPEIASTADRTFQVSIDNGVSKVEVL